MRPIMSTFTCLFLAVTIVTGQSKKTEKMMQDYLAFYFPATGESFYEITFDWGSYTFITGAGPDDELHPDSEPYRGFVTARPSPLNSDEGEMPSFLITPKGEVWVHQEQEGEIPEYNSREEKVVEKDKYGTTTTTTTIQSPLEPLVDHFKEHPEGWNKYGVIQVGKKSKFVSK